MNKGRDGAKSLAANAFVCSPRLRRIYRRNESLRFQYYNIDFVSGLNIVLGPCQSGKTTLIRDIILYYIDKRDGQRGPQGTIRQTGKCKIVIGGSFNDDMRPKIRSLAEFNLFSDASLEKQSIGKRYMAYIEDVISEVGPSDLLILDDFNEYLDRGKEEQLFKRILARGCQAVLTTNRSSSTPPSGALIINLDSDRDGTIRVKSIEKCPITSSNVI